MPKVVVIAQIKDPAKWEAGFRTHGEVFKTYGLEAPVHFTVAGNEIAICFEPRDVGAFMNVIQQPATIAAMEFDGVLRDTVKPYVLDKEFKP